MVSLVTFALIAAFIGYKLYDEQCRLSIERNMQMIREAMRDVNFDIVRDAFAEFTLSAEEAAEGFRRMGEVISQQCELIPYMFGVGEPSIEPMYNGCIRTLDDGNYYFPCRAPTEDDSDFCNTCLEELRASVES